MNDRENPLISLTINIVLPAIVLIKFSGEDQLGPVIGLIVALAFPFIYGVVDLIRKQKWNVISIIGVVSIILTGGIGLLELDVQWLALKEAAVPFIIALIVLGSMRTRYPVLKTLLEKIIDTDKVHAVLQKKHKNDAYERLIRNGTFLFAISFLVSTILNYILTKMIVTSPAGTPEFTAELGRLTALSYPFIAIPSVLVGAVALVYIMHGITKITGLDMETILKEK